jgi:hypothetical protein
LTKKTIYSSRIEILGLIVLLIIGAIWRFYYLESSSLWLDEGFSFVAGDFFLANKEVLSPSLNSLFSGLGLAIFGQRELALRFFPAVFGCLLIIAGYLVAKKIFPKHYFAPWLVALFLALSTWQISWSRQGRTYTLVSLLTLLVVYYWQRGLSYKFNKQSVLSLITACAWLLLAILAHKLAILFVVPLAIVALKYFPKERFYQYWLAFILVVIALLIAILNYQFFLRSLQNWEIALWPYWRFLVDQHLMFTVSFLLAAIGGQFVLRLDYKANFNFFVLMVVSTFLLVAIFAPLLNYRYLVPLVPLVIIVIAVFLETLVQKIAQHFNLSCLSRWSLMIATGLCWLFFLGQLTWLPQKYYQLESDLESYQFTDYRVKTPQSDFKAALAWLRENDLDQRLIITSHPEILSFYRINPAYFLPFHLEEVRAWDEAQRVNYLSLPLVNSLEQLDLLILDGALLVIDEYALSKLPLELSLYLQNYPPLYSKKTNLDSIIYIYGAK